MNEAERASWRAFASVLPMSGLMGLLEALENDSPRLISGATCYPPPLQCCQNDFVEKACAVAYAACFGAPHSYPVSELEMLFAQACWNASALTGDPNACRYFLNYWDETPRAQLRAEMIPELKLAVNNRAAELGTRPAIAGAA